MNKSDILKKHCASYQCFCIQSHTPSNLPISSSSQVLSVSIDEDKMIPYIMSTLNNAELAFRLATRNGLPGADSLVVDRFNMFMNTGNFGEAAKIAARSPRVQCLEQWMISIT